MLNGVEFIRVGKSFDHRRIFAKVATLNNIEVLQYRDDDGI